MSQQPYNAGDALQVKERVNRVKTLEERAKNGLRYILANADGRLWLYQQLAEAGPFQDPHAGNSNVTAYNCGARAWAMRLTAKLLDDHLADYCKMMAENKETA